MPLFTQLIYLIHNIVLQISAPQFLFFITILTFNANIYQFYKPYILITILSSIESKKYSEKGRYVAIFAFKFNESEECADNWYTGEDL